MSVPFTRSLINDSVRRAKTVLNHFGFQLPEFSYWNIAQWGAAGPEWDPVRGRMLGWDVTDFGSGSFHEIGRVLFTMRNGLISNAIRNRIYAEKVLIDPESQRAPAHWHRSKCEDIICRHGGNILVQLTALDGDNQPAKGFLDIEYDSTAKRIASGETVWLRPGQSVTISPGTLHQFWCEEGTGWKLDGIGYTLSSEISSICDDWSDNVFLTPASRFPEVSEDEPPQVWLCHEYPKSIGS